MKNYIYGIISTSKPAIFGQSLLSSSPEGVYTIVYRDLACVVSDYTAGDLASLSREDKFRCLMDHQSVTERVMAGGYTILPVKFGTIVENEDEIQRILEQGYNKLDRTLEQMEGLVEMEVAATWDLRRVLQEIGTAEEIMRLKRTMAGKSASQTLQMRVSVGKLAKEALDRRREGYRRQTIQPLAEAALDIQMNPLVAEEMVMNLAFLIQKGKQEDFDSQARQINEALGDQINLRVVGPLPPYSFSTVEIKRINPGEIEEARQLLALGANASGEKLKEAYRYLAAKNYPNTYLYDKTGNERFARVRGALVLLRDYCQGQSETAGYNPYDQHYSLTPEEVSHAFLIEIKRPALQTG